MSSPADVVDRAALGAWLREQGLGAWSGELEPVGGGTQNVVLRTVVGGRPVVLRHPPVHPRPGSARTIAREITVLDALRGSGVPHPALVAACTDPGVLGQPFFLMDDVDGVNPGERVSPEQAADPGLRHGAALDVARAAARLGRLDPVTAGLDGLRRPGPFLSRQVPRWTAQLASYTEVPGYDPGDLPDTAVAAQWLERHRPPEPEPGVAHGDLHLNNVLLDRTRPRVAALVDWEMCTVGDPLLDLGWLLVTWPVDPVGFGAGTELAAHGGLPTRAELIAAYADAGGRDTGHVTWYAGLAAFKLGIVLEGSWARVAAGEAPRAVGERLHTAAVALLELAVRIARDEWAVSAG
ncbi:phosphotransferase family protein [Pseudonocardia spirodelae]|uniref:Phosphotransferase family protein n=1 Tax=Pseudonocardia spirodelae TaxID=3133431 RepID=A0ABU8T0L7_9PSEU